MSAAALKYYNFDKIFSYNALFNYVVGPRGNGKTYGAKKKALLAAIRKGDQFIYLRRYKEELKVSAQTFFADISMEFPDHDFRLNGAKAEMSPVSTRELEKKRPWAHIGYFIALSTAQGQKSVSFPKVKIIIYDEFIIEKGLTRYLPNETTAFINFYNTVDRYQEKTKVLFLANAVSIENPYFIEYKIEPDGHGFITKFPDKNGVPFLAVHIIDPTEFAEGVSQTRLGQFIANSEYADYALGNEFADNNDNLLGNKNSSARYHYTIETKSGTFSVWIDWNGPRYFIQEKLPKQQDVYTIVPERMKAGKTLLLPNDKMLQSLRSAYRTNKLWFDSARSRNAFIEVFKR